MFDNDNCNFQLDVNPLYIPKKVNTEQISLWAAEWEKKIHSYMCTCMWYWFFFFYWRNGRKKYSEWEKLCVLLYFLFYFFILYVVIPYERKQQHNQKIKIHFLSQVSYFFCVCLFFYYQLWLLKKEKTKLHTNSSIKKHTKSKQKKVKYESNWIKPQFVFWCELMAYFLQKREIVDF